MNLARPSLTGWLTPPELGLRGNRGRRSGQQASRSSEAPTGSPSGSGSNRRRDPRGTSQLTAPQDSPPANPRSNPNPTNPDTTPKHSRACHTTPKRSLASGRLRVHTSRQHRRRSCHTTHKNQAPIHCRQNNTASRCPRDKRTPTGPPSANDTLVLPSRIASGRIPPRHPNLQTKPHETGWTSHTSLLPQGREPINSSHCPCVTSCRPK